MQNRIGPYELRGELGRGAMARVWRAWDSNLQREVAIKEPIFDSRLSGTLLDELGKRFVAEGRAAARLSHPGIVTIYAADVWDGRPAIVMELIEGETLGSRLRRGPMDARDAYSVLGQLLSAVGYAHARGVVHRDIKPENVFLTTDGRVKLADFGIARVDGSAATVGTIAGTVLGTPGYMSPEQATGRSVDARSDLFSVGVVAYEMLTGANPFGAGTGTDATTLIYRIVHEPAPELPAAVSYGLPVDMRPAIMAALAKDPAARPQSAEQFWAMLAGEGAVSPRHVSETRQNASRGVTWLPYVLLAVVAAVVLGFTFLNAQGGTGGGGGGASSGDSAPQAGDAEGVDTEPDDESGDSAATKDEASDGESAGTSSSGSLYYLAVSEGKVAIFSNSSATPYEVSDVDVADLGSSSATELDAHVPASSVDEAHELLAAYEKEAQAAREETQAREAQAAREAEIQANPFQTSSADASSTLRPDEVTSYYGPNNAIDDVFETAWNEGVSGNGIGEWISINASGEKWARGVMVVNGYPKRDEIYYYNNRCRDVTIELSDGYTIEYTLSDSYREWQYIDFDDYHKTSYIKLTIDSVYEGSKWTDTSICEMRAY